MTLSRLALKVITATRVSASLCHLRTHAMRINFDQKITFFRPSLREELFNN